MISMFSTSDGNSASKTVQQIHQKISFKTVIFVGNMSYIIQILDLGASILHRSIMIVPTVPAAALCVLLSSPRTKMGARQHRIVIFFKEMSCFIRISRFTDLQRDLTHILKARPLQIGYNYQQQIGNMIQGGYNFDHIIFKMSYFIRSC